MMGLLEKKKTKKNSLNQTERMWLKKILIKKYIAFFGLEDIHYLELDSMIENILSFGNSSRNLILNL